MKDHCTIKMFNIIIIIKLFYNVIFPLGFYNYSKSRYVYSTFFLLLIFVYLNFIIYMYVLLWL